MFLISTGKSEEDAALSFDQRIASLVVRVTNLISTHVTRSLQPQHRLAFATALCAAIAADEGNLTKTNWRSLISPEVNDPVRFFFRFILLDFELYMLFRILN